MGKPVLDNATIVAVVDAALIEDLGVGDITTKAVVPSDVRFKFSMTTRQDITLAGLPVATEVFKRLAPEAKLETFADDGDRLAKGTVIMTIEGLAEGLLTAERTALNIVQTLSGIATFTNQFVDEIAGTGATLLDTRKTLPGLRVLSKYAVAMGGGTNHRMRLDDAVLIKDNHIAVAGSNIGEATRRAKAAGLPNVEVECDTIDQVREAIEAGADSLLLDNMPPPVLCEAVAINAGRVPLEASGGVNLQTIRAIAETGVDFISVGAITQSAPAVDIGLDVTITK